MENHANNKPEEARVNWSAYASTMVLCFSRWESGTPCGNVWSYCLKDPRAFRGLDGLLFAVDEMLDDIGSPQAWCRPRDLSAKRSNRSRRTAPRTAPREVLKPCYAPGELPESRGELYTAVVRVHCRQHASIQGELMLEGKVLYFRSGLELMRLLREALAPTLGGEKTP